MDRAPEDLTRDAAPDGVASASARREPADAKDALPRHWGRSLFGEILDWMLAPLLFLWPVSMALEYYVSVSIASAAYDRELDAKVRALASALVVKDGRIATRLDAQAPLLIGGDEGENAFSVRGQDNELLAGNPSLPSIEFTLDLVPNRVYFTDHEALGMRAGYMFAQVPGGTSAALVQFAETEDKRRRLASEIIGRVLASQFIIVPVAVLLVWFGLSKGISPLNDIRAKIRARRPNDLSPIAANDAPQELQPFVESINDLMGRLDGNIRAQRRFVADAAHQMRTPLAGLKTQAELVLRQTRREDVEHSVRQIAASVDRTTHMVNQLLSLARAEADGAVVLRRVDLARIAREATAELVGRALERGIDLGYDGPEAAVALEGNPPLLRELIVNLVDNALRYTPAGGRITVRVAAAGAEARLDVEDTGIGIPPEDREFVFERFFRAPNALEYAATGESPGSGLGLAIVREIAHQHRAVVTIDDPPDGGPGTVFRVTFDRSGMRIPA